MGIDFRWRSRAGARTGDNRDYGCIGIRGDEALCVVLDGSTTGRDSGALARAIGTALIDGYVASEDQIDEDGLVTRLRDIHAALVPAYPQASASYLLAFIREDERALILHAGDCLVGRWREEGQVEWLCRPHTLANALDDLAVAAIAAEDTRHRLTRSFRAREFMRPDIARHDGGRQLIVATDGFWADLTVPEQLLFLDSPDAPETGAGDDCSVLQILTTDAPRGAITNPQPRDTLYVRRR
jgi:serine/threonine protein phosphatase PrpC